MKKALAVRNLYKSFQRKRNVLHGVHFSCEQGVTTGFIGANGSGKTTALKCILEFIFPDQGEIYFFDSQKLSPAVKQKIGYLPERPYLYEFLTAEEFLRFHWELSGGGPQFRQRAQRVLKLVSLSGVEDKKLRQFSKGMLQRIGLAQALLRDPEFLLLDEPMSGLDPDGRILIKDIIREEQKRGATIFFSSHLLSDMEELCRDLVVMDAGQVLYEGSLLSLVFQFESEYRIRFIEAQGKEIKEISCSQRDLQSQLDFLRQKSCQILGVAPSQLGIEKAFSTLRENKMRPPP